MSTSNKKQRERTALERREQAQRTATMLKRTQRRRTVRNWVIAIAAGALVLGGLYVLFTNQQEPSAAGTAASDYQVASPGPGADAPDFTLSTAGGEDFTLSNYRGERVLLYFHEGLGCQPCWDQLGDLEQELPQLEATGIDELVSITSAPVDLLNRKMNDDGLESTALADPDLAVINQYGANTYGMMGDSAAGHTFLVVGPDGRIEWRADYGGPPNYTMYLSVEQILADYEAGRTNA